MATPILTEDENTKETLGYQVFIIEAMMSPFAEYLDPNQIIDSLGFEALVKEEIEGKGRREGARQLVQEVLKEPREHVSLFIAALRDMGFERFIDVLDDRFENKDMKRAAEKYELMLLMLEGKLKKKIYPSEIIDDLVPLLGEGDYERILTKETNEGAFPACRDLFTCMKRKTSNWPVKFLDALYKNKPELLAKIDPSLENGVMTAISNNVERTVTDGRNDETQQTAVKEIIGTRSDVAEDSDEEDYRLALSDEEKQDYEDLEKDLLPSGRDGRPQLNMRKYQLELADKALEGQNTIVYAPTGSGKTRVAIYIAKHVLDNTVEEDKRKVLILEPTVALVDQTYKAIHHFLGKDYKMVKVRGRDEHSVSLHTLLPVNNVLVMTPKILDNHLENGRISSISSLCRLIILDECHHTRKGEVYNNIMLRYLKEKSIGQGQLPQILGLTATLGVEKALITEDAIANILKLCANLDTSVIASVERHVEELKRLVAVPEEETINLTENHESPSYKVIEAAMTKVEVYLTQFSALEEDTVNQLTSRAQMDQSSQMYNQWTVFLKDAATTVDTRDESSRTEMIHNLYVVGDHLYKYNVALTLEENVRVKDVIEYLRRELLSTGLGSSHTDCEIQLQEIAKGVIEALVDHESKRKLDRTYENPRLTQLADILENIVKNNEEDCRGIIFARTRVMCAAIAKWLNADEHLPQSIKDLHADVFTGLQARGYEGGMTQAQQDTVLAKFRNGQIKLIVATSVAHEGLDIPNCNNVITYNHVGNEITTLQTRGRNRMHGGKSFLLASEKVREKQQQNMFKVHQMREAISKIKDMSLLDVEKRLVVFQKEALKTAEQKDLRRKLNALEMKDVGFTMKCKKCKVVCTTESKMRLINNTHRVTIDKEVKKTKILIFEYSNPEVYDEVSIDGGICCRECKQSWGTWVTYQGVQYPSLSIKNFSVKSQDVEKPQVFKQWKKCPYVITPLSTDDTLRYLREDEDSSESNDDDDDDDDDEFDLC